MRAAHPPTCPYPECRGKTFGQQKGLKAHLKIHEGRDLDGRLDGGEDAASGGEPATKKKRGGDHGRDWACDFEGCTKDFKSVFPSSGFWTHWLTYEFNRKRRLRRITTSRTSANAISRALTKGVENPMATNTFSNVILHRRIEPLNHPIAPVIRKTTTREGSGWT